MPTKLSAVLRLSNAFQIVHAVDSHRWLNVSNIHVANVSNSDSTVRICLVAPGDTATQSNAVIWDFTIAAADFLEFGEGMILEPNWTIQALAADNLAMTIQVFGIEDV